MIWMTVNPRAETNRNRSEDQQLLGLDSKAGAECEEEVRNICTVYDGPRTTLLGASDHPKLGFTHRRSSLVALIPYLRQSTRGLDFFYVPHPGSIPHMTNGRLLQLIRLFVGLRHVFPLWSVGNIHSLISSSLHNVLPSQHTTFSSPIA